MKKIERIAERSVGEAAELRRCCAQKQIGAGKPTPTNSASTGAKD
jgi:hypothetical protein